MDDAKCRILFMLLLSFSYFLIELIVGCATNAMSLVADAFHMFSDVLSLIIAFISIKISPKKWSRSTFGLARAEIIGALINSVFLLALCFAHFVESVLRLFKPEEMERPMLVLIVGSIGLVIDVTGIFLFRESASHSHLIEDPGALRKKSSQINMKAVFLHVLADALGSVIVIMSATIALSTNWHYRVYIDPILSILMVIIITCTAWPLASESTLILLQTVPTYIEVSLIKKKLEKIDGVLAVHELHIWQLTGDRIIASAHIHCQDLEHYMQISDCIKEFFHNEGIHSTTIQPEFVDLPIERKKNNELEKCIIECPPKNSENCSTQTCCNNENNNNKSESGL